MSSLAQSLTGWEEFLALPERGESGVRFELHDGRVVVMPPPRPLHLKIQKRIERLLEAVAAGKGVIATEFPYRPLPNLQYWIADVAYIPQPEWDAMPPHEYPVYSPPLIVEVLSPSNTPAKVNRQRIVALSAGTQEFWVVDADERTVLITDASATRTFAESGTIAVSLFRAATIRVQDIFIV